MLVPIILGSTVDEEFAGKITAQLDKYEIPYKIHVASAHKVPEKVLEIVQGYNNTDDAICYITIAGRSNGLSGVVAANSIHPVIACPPFKDKVDMMVNINSTLQMPSDTPVITVVDPKNAVLAVGRILGIKEKAVQEKMKARLDEVKASFT